MVYCHAVNKVSHTTRESGFCERGVNGTELLEQGGVMEAQWQLPAGLRTTCSHSQLDQRPWASYHHWQSIASHLTSVFTTSTSDKKIGRYVMKKWWLMFTWPRGQGSGFLNDNWRTSHVTTEWLMIHTISHVTNDWRTRISHQTHCFHVGHRQRFPGWKSTDYCTSYYTSSPDRLIKMKAGLRWSRFNPRCAADGCSGLRLCRYQEPWRLILQAKTLLQN